MGKIIKFPIKGKHKPTIRNERIIKALKIIDKILKGKEDENKNKKN